MHIGSPRVIYDNVFTSDNNYYFKTIHRPEGRRLTESITADIVVVGAGLSGLATAQHLAMTHGVRVTMVERHFAGWGASGRNGGEILPGFMAPPTRMIRRFGMDTTRDFWDLSLQGVRAIVSNIRTHGISCDLKQGFLSPMMAAHYSEAYVDAECERREKLGAPLGFVDAEQTAKTLGTPADYYAGAFTDTANSYHFHPLKYLLGLKNVLENTGQVDIYEETDVVGIDSNRSGVILYTPKGRISARKVILCGDSYLGRLVPRLRRKYVLIRNAMIGTDILPDPAAVIPGDVCVSENGGQLLFYRRTADNRLIIGGGDAIRPSGNMNDTEDKIVDLCRNSMARLFPSLENIAIPYVWGGYIGITSSYMPYLGTLDKRVYFMGGYSGHGLNLTHIIGRAVADAAVRGAPNTGTVLDRIRNLSMPGLGDYDGKLANIGMWLESVKERFD